MVVSAVPKIEIQRPWPTMAGGLLSSLMKSPVWQSSRQTQTLSERWARSVHAPGARKWPSASARMARGKAGAAYRYFSICLNRSRRSTRSLR